MNIQQIINSIFKRTKSDINNEKRQRVAADENLQNEISVLRSSSSSSTYTAGTGIKIENGVISVDLDVIQKKLIAGNNITIENDTISATGGATDILVNTEEASDDNKLLRNLKIGNSVYLNEPYHLIDVGNQFLVEDVCFDITENLEAVQFTNNALYLSMFFIIDKNAHFEFAINKDANSDIVNIRISQNGEYFDLTQDSSIQINIQNAGIVTVYDLLNNQQVMDFLAIQRLVQSKIDLVAVKITKILGEEVEEDYLSTVSAGNYFEMPEPGVVE